MQRPNHATTVYSLRTPNMTLLWPSIYKLMQRQQYDDYDDDDHDDHDISIFYYAITPCTDRQTDGHTDKGL